MTDGTYLLWFRFMSKSKSSKHSVSVGRLQPIAWLFYFVPSFRVAYFFELKTFRFWHLMLYTQFNPAAQYWLHGISIAYGMLQSTTIKFLPLQFFLDLKLISLPLCTPWFPETLNPSFWFHLFCTLFFFPSASFSFPMQRILC